MKRDDFANARVHCRRCGHQMRFCVQIDRGGVPQELRCSLGGGGGGGSEIRCSGCRAPCFRAVDDLKRAVDVALRRGWGPHIRAGAVEIECSE